MGLAAFGLSGAVVGIQAGAHFFGVLSLALLTASGGGMLRDLLVNEVPEVLHGGFYGSVALLQGAAIYALHEADLLSPYTLLGAFCAALALRLVAYRRKWRLPKPAALPRAAAWRAREDLNSQPPDPKSGALSG